MKDLTRRQVRYLCFRLQTEADGGNPATPEDSGVMSFVDEIKEHMEGQDDFGGWSMFAKTWDVDEKSPLVVVKRTSSIYTDWNKILKDEAKDFPKPPVTTKIIETPTPAPSKTTSHRDSSGKFAGKTKPTQTAPIEEIKPLEETKKKKSFWKILS